MLLICAKEMKTEIVVRMHLLLHGFHWMVAENNETEYGKE